MAAPHITHLNSPRMDARPVSPREEAHATPLRDHLRPVVLQSDSSRRTSKGKRKSCEVGADLDGIQAATRRRCVEFGH